MTGPGRSSGQDSPAPGEGPAGARDQLPTGQVTTWGLKGLRRGKRLGLGLPPWTPGEGSPGAPSTCWHLVCEGGARGPVRPPRSIPCGPSRARTGCSPTGPGADRTGSGALSGRLHHMTRLTPPSPSVSRSGRPSDRHHHRLPHHGHSCSDHNSCLKKLVRVLALLVWKWRLRGSRGGCAHKRVLLLNLAAGTAWGAVSLCQAWAPQSTALVPQPASRRLAESRRPDSGGRCALCTPFSRSKCLWVAPWGASLFLSLSFFF